MPFISNTKFAQALRGQSVIITAGQSDIANMQEYSVGDIVIHGNSGKLGRVHSVDYYGNSLKIEPIQPNLNFSTGSGYFNDQEGIDIYNP